MTEDNKGRTKTSVLLKLLLILLIAVEVGIFVVFLLWNLHVPYLWNHSQTKTNYFVVGFSSQSSGAEGCPASEMCSAVLTFLPSRWPLSLCVSFLSALVATKHQDVSITTNSGLRQ